MREVQIYGVSFDMVGKQPIVLLKTVDDDRYLPIWIGHPEAAAILMKLQGADTPRPMTHDLMVDMLDQVETKVERITVNELRDNTFFATIVLSVNGTEIEIDSRPSDALALAVRVQAPIFVAEEVIEESSIEFDQGIEDNEQVVEKFKDFQTTSRQRIFFKTPNCKSASFAPPPLATRPSHSNERMVGRGSVNCLLLNRRFSGPWR